jgi:hypothetical protein
VRGLAEGEVVNELAKEDCMLDQGEWKDGSADDDDPAPALDCAPVSAPGRLMPLPPLPCPPPCPWLCPGRRSVEEGAVAAAGAEFVDEGVEGDVGMCAVRAPLLL